RKRYGRRADTRLGATEQLQFQLGQVSSRGRERPAVGRCFATFSRRARVLSRRRNARRDGPVTRGLPCSFGKLATLSIIAQNAVSRRTARRRRKCTNTGTNCHSCRGTCS